MAEPTAKTGFDKYFEERIQDPEFATAYSDARIVIDETDKLIRTLEKIRVEANITKAELARKIDAQPANVRRLLTSEEANPTIATVLGIAEALNFKLCLVPAGQIDE